MIFNDQHGCHQYSGVSDIPQDLFKAPSFNKPSQRQLPTMNYLSTRGRPEALPFSKILVDGLAPDGGLYVPEHFPQLTTADLTAMRSMSYKELAFAIISRFVDDSDIPHADLQAIINHTYRRDVFSYNRPNQDATDITPILTLDKNLHLLSLSNGPTLAFKDIAMQLLGNLFEYVLARENKTLNILGATSGDTGSAAEYAMRGKERVRVFMLSPYGKMSPFQTAQMYSLQDTNIFNIAVDNGTFDDCQDLVKWVSGDADFKARYNIGAVNSINWARIIAQTVYYFKGYFAVTASNNEQVSFTVPTGNFGNAYAGYVARRMGLPIAKIVVATNENDALDEFFKFGVHTLRRDVVATSSPSMDISKASNLERLVFELLGRDPDQLSLWYGLESMMDNDEQKSKMIALTTEAGFSSGHSKHTDRVQMIHRIHEHYGVIIDPHTADGMKVALEQRDANLPMLVLETALPAKFASIIEEALQINPERPATLQDLESRPQKVKGLRLNPQDRLAYLGNIGYRMPPHPLMQTLKDYIKNNIVDSHRLETAIK